MKYLFLAVLIILVILSIAAGGVKIFNMPQEIELFENAGLNPSWLLPLGALQIIGGLLATYNRTRRAGSAVMALGFLISTVVIFKTGNLEFGVFSLLPVFFSAIVFWRSTNSPQSQS